MLVLRMAVAVAVAAVSPGCNAQGFVHGHECDKADYDPHAQEEVAVRFEHDELDAVEMVFT